MLFYHAAYDDCLRCCIAGMLDKPITEVADFNMFLRDNKDWFKHVCTYVHRVLQHRVKVLNPHSKTEGYTIGVMENYDGTTHTVILGPCKDGSWVVHHDPDPKCPVFKRLVAKLVLEEIPQSIDMSKYFKEPVGLLWLGEEGGE